MAWQPNILAKGGSLPLFHFQPFCKVTFWLQLIIICLYLWYSIMMIVREAWLVSPGVLLSHICSFILHFCTKVKSMAHDHHIHYRRLEFVFCIFMACPEPAMCISSIGSLPMQTAVSLIFSCSFRSRKSALIARMSYILGVGIGAFLYSFY